MEYYKKDIKTIFKEFNTSENGLDEKKVEVYKQKYGLNELPKSKKDSVFKIFFNQINDPIIYLLIVAAFLSFIASEILDGLVIILIILVDAIVGVVEEIKARKSAESLQKMIRIQAKVIREGKELKIDSKDIVPGDIISLEPGDKVPADSRIIDSKNLTVDESALTGESTSAIKSNCLIDKDVLLAERQNMLYAGTSIMTGRCTCVIVATGKNTELGKIASTVSETKEAKSPLTLRLEKFSKQITILVLGCAFLVTISLILKDFSFTEIFLSVIALAVSAMPEGLPLAMTMALTVGSNRMAKKNVIVKKLNAVESLGSCTVIASDKTGTLTVNEQTAKKIVLPSKETFDITGVGYNTKGKVIGEKLDEAKYIAKLGQMNNEAVFRKNKNNYEVYGDSIDIAFLVLASKLKLENTNKILEVIPYESEKKYSAVYYEDEKYIRCTAKGSIEKIFSFCNKMKVGNKKVKLDKKLIIDQNEKLASEGYRVIALCDGKCTKQDLKKNTIKNLTFIGLVGFIDPIRTDAKEAVKECTEAGIKVIMITGDHPLTAFSIAKDLGIVQSKNEIAVSEELELVYNKGEEAFDNFIKVKKVFSRVTPLQKLYIVDSLRRQGEFVSVTGDGVNDAPAIKAANIGVAMGSGTDVAKETANMIIVDDSFKSIVSGIKEGRIAYNNIRKIAYLLLSCGIAEVLFYLLSILFNTDIPLLAIQLLWLNLVTDGIQDIALSLEKEDDGVMKEKPRNTKESIFNKLFFEETFLAGIYTGILVFAVWFCLVNVFNFEVGVSRGYIMALMVFIQNMHVLNCRSEKKSVFNCSFKTNPFVIITILSTTFLQFIIMEVEVFSRMLKTHKIPLDHLIILIILSSTIIYVMEIFKKIKFKKN